MPTDNPYLAPESDLELVDQAPRKMLGWKIYFWMLLLLQCLFIFSNFYEEVAVGWQEVVDCFIYIFVLAGVFGLAFQKKIFLIWFWRYFIVALLIWDVSYTAMQFFEHGMDDVSQLTFAFTLLFLSPFIFFQYFALYKYAFQSTYLWHK